VRRQAPRHRARALPITGNKALTCGYGGALGGTRTPNLLIRSSMWGHPGPFRSVRNLGRVPVRCSSSYGFPKGCSSRWLPAWLPRRRVHGSGGRRYRLANLCAGLARRSFCPRRQRRSFRICSGSCLLGRSRARLSSLIFRLPSTRPPGSGQRTNDLDRLGLVCWACPLVDGRRDDQARPSASNTR
jgi:hypothetical protein